MIALAGFRVNLWNYTFVHFVRYLNEGWARPIRASTRSCTPTSTRSIGADSRASSRAVPVADRSGTMTEEPVTTPLSWIDRQWLRVAVATKPLHLHLVIILRLRCPLHFRLLALSSQQTLQQQILDVKKKKQFRLESSLSTAVMATIITWTIQSVNISNGGRRIAIFFALLL